MIDTGCALESLAMRSSEAATGTRTTMQACSISTTTGPTTTTTTSASADPTLQHLDAGHAATEGSILVESIPQKPAKARQQAKPKTAAAPTGAVVESCKRITISAFGEVPADIKRLVNCRARRKLTKQERQLVYVKCNGRCAYCGIELNGKFQVDHADAFYRGGECSLDNFLPACAPCNNYKLTYSVEEFRSVIGRQHELALRNSMNYRTLFRFGMVEIKTNSVVFYFETISQLESRNE